jgi:hypothetical protein
MNQTQKAWLWIGLVGLAAMMVFPPWQFSGELQRRRVEPAGYAPLWKPPPPPMLAQQPGNFNPDGFLDFVSNFFQANPGKHGDDEIIAAYWKANPVRYEPDLRYSVVLDFSRLGVQALGLGFLTAAFVLTSATLTPRRRPRLEEQAQETPSVSH